MFRLLLTRWEVGGQAKKKLPSYKIKLRTGEGQLTSPDGELGGRGTLHSDHPKTLSENKQRQKACHGANYKREPLGRSGGNKQLILI